MLPRTLPRWTLILIGVATFIGCSPSGEANGSGSDRGEQSEQSISPGPAGRDGAGQASSSSPDWRSAPLVPRFNRTAAARLAREVSRSRRAGMRAGVFAKIGDSNSDYPAQFHGLGCRTVEFGRHRYLAPTLRRYRAIDLGRVATYPGCRPANSFSRSSAAATSNATTVWALSQTVDQQRQGFALPAPCPDRSTPIECEIRRIKPRYVSIMIGTGDAIFGQPLGRVYARNLARIIRKVRALGPVPVVSTVPPVSPAPGGERERIGVVNRIVFNVTRRLGVPLVNVWRAMMNPRMVNQGLAPDGLHLGVYGGDGAPRILRNAANLTDAAIRYGANRRNLLWLQTLHRLDRTVARHLLQRG